MPLKVKIIHSQHYRDDDWMDDINRQLKRLEGDGRCNIKFIKGSRKRGFEVFYYESLDTNPYYYKTAAAPTVVRQPEFM